jgi:hypothetical protein
MDIAQPLSLIAGAFALTAWKESKAEASIEA